MVSSLLTQRVRRARLAELLDACPSGAGGWWPRLRSNVLALAAELARLVPPPTSSGGSAQAWRFGLALELSTKESDRAVLDEMTIDAARDVVKVGVRGFCDAYEAGSRTLVEVKVALGEGAQRNPAPLWAAQASIYAALAAEPGAPGFSPTRLLVADLGGGTIWSHSGWQAPAAEAQEGGGAAGGSAGAGASAAGASAAIAAWPGATRLQASARRFLARAMQRELFRPEHIDRVLRTQRNGTGVEKQRGSACA